MTASRKLLLALAVIALAQTGVLAAMVVDRTLLLKNGREITLPIVPVDPRDLFRGEYVRLGYDINTVPAMLLVGPPPARNAAFYVTLEKNPQGGWTPVKVSAVQAQRDQSRSDRAEGPVAISVSVRHARDTTASKAISCPRARAGGWRIWRARSGWLPALPSTAAATPRSRASSSTACSSTRSRCSEIVQSCGCAKTGGGLKSRGSVMTIKRHEPSKIYSKVVEANGFVFTAGIVADDIKQDVKGQTQQVLAEIDRLLKVARHGQDPRSCPPPSGSPTSARATP